MLISSITEARYVAQISEAVSYERLKPHLFNAEQKYIMPLLQQEMYDELTQYHANTGKYKIYEPGFTMEPTEGVSEEDYMHAVLLWYAQHAIVNIAYHIGFDVLNSYISNTGFSRLESESTKSLFKYQEDNLKRYFLTTGLNSLDTMLHVLQEQKNHFEAFAGQIKKLQGRIFPTTNEFNQAYNINNSRLIFMHLQQYIAKVEDIDMEREIGQENMEQIFDALANQDETPLDDKTSRIVELLRPPIAYLATAYLMSDTGAQISERGLFFTGMRSINDSGLELPTEPEKVLALIERNKEIANQYLARLRRHLGLDWELPQNPRTINRDNTGKKTFFV